jgi:L,D-transpeptidase catalytic domain
VYADTGAERTRYGYLRAGAIVDARGPIVTNESCEGGWYRVNPRGFVCVGLGASRDLSQPVVVQSARRPTRGQGFPYVYALSNALPPLLYFRLPSKEQMREAEGEEGPARGQIFRETERVQGLDAWFGHPGAPPAFLSAGQKLEKPYGVKQPPRYLAHAGKTTPDSGFALASSFEWQDRFFGLTTELDVIALDRVKLVRPSDFHGTELSSGETLPVGFVWSHYTPKYLLDPNGDARPVGVFEYRQPVKLTGKSKPGGLLETSDGSWAVESTLRMVPRRDSFPSFVTGDRKWLDISVREQSLVAYIGTRAVYATLVSTGRGGLGDPERDQATVRGTFMIYQKEVSSTMDGEDDRSDSFNLRDVPFVQYFYNGYALHGTYWHDEFGTIRSHGCVNLAPVDAAWLFEWTDPVVPPEWHGVLNKDRGTVVYIRP